MTATETSVRVGGVSETPAADDTHADGSDGTVPAVRAGWRRVPLELVAASVSYFVIALGGLAVRSPIGHDEGVYALRARDLADGWTINQGSYWADYRAPGLPMMLSAVNRVIGEHVTTMRFVVVLLGWVMLLATWHVARTYGGRVLGFASLFVLLSASALGLTATRLLADIPGAALSMVCIALFVSEAERSQLRWSMLVVPLLGGFATVSRFGAPWMLGAGLSAAGLVVLPRLIRERRWDQLRNMAVAAVGLAATTSVVLFTGAISSWGSSPYEANMVLGDAKSLSAWTGIRDLRNVVNPWSAYPSPVWVSSLLWIPLVGIVATLVGVVAGKVDRRVFAFASVSSVISLVGLVTTVGLVVENYLVLTLPFWAILIGQGYAWLGAAALGRASSGAARRVLGAAGLIVLIAVTSVVAGDVRRGHDSLVSTFSALRSFSSEFGASAPDDCVILTSYAPQAGFYSECEPFPWVLRSEGSALDEYLRRTVDWATTLPGRTPTEGNTFAVVLEGGKRQPPDELLFSGVGLGPVLVEAGEPGKRRRYGWVAEVLPCAWDATCEAQPVVTE